jgi:hypothetical protein
MAAIGVDVAHATSLDGERSLSARYDRPGRFGRTEAVERR